MAKKLVNGKIVEFEYTSEEITAMQTAAKKAERMEKSRPMTEAEVNRMLIAKQINSLDVDGNTALRMQQFYPAFTDVVGQTVGNGFKFTHDGKLWQVIQQSMTVQAHYAPGAGTESLYAEVCESHEGTEDDPIPYEGNMALEEGKCYVQEYEVFRCVRDTGNPVYHPLKELLGLYVEEVTA